MGEWIETEQANPNCKLIFFRTRRPLYCSQIAAPDKPVGSLGKPFLASEGQPWDLPTFMLRKVAPFVADLWPHRELLWQFTVRQVELRHRGSHLGLLWAILNPLLMLGLYVLVFGYIFGGRFGILPDETRIDYALGIFFGLTLFHFFAEVLTIAPTLIIANPNFVKKVVFPLAILPAADSHTHTTQVRLELPRGIEGLYPGMFARAHFAVGRVKKLLIPASAVAMRSEVAGTYVVAESGEIRFRQLRLGEAAGEQEVEVLAGVAAGEKVALDPVAALAALKRGGK